MPTTVTWALSLNGEPSQLMGDYWGLDVDGCTFSSLESDVLKLHFTGKKVSEAPPFVDGDLIRVFKVIDGAPTGYFFGRVKFPSGMSDVRTETQFVEVHGPWEWLKNYLYMQTWVTKTWVPAGEGALYGSGTWTTSDVVLPRANLFAAAIGGSPVYLSLADQMKAILDYLLAHATPVPFTYSGSNISIADCTPPFREVNSVSCAEAITQCLRFAPDAVMWFDYSSVTNVTAVPTLNIKSYSNLTAVDIAAIGLASRLQVAPVVEQKTPCVRIVYEISSPTQQYQNYENWVPVVDKYPETENLEYAYGAVNYICNLRGRGLGSGTTEVSNVVVEPLPLFTSTVPKQNDAAMNNWVFSHCDFVTKGLTPDPDTGRIKLIMNNAVVGIADLLGYSNLVYYELNADGTKKNVGGYPVTFTPSGATYPNALIGGNIMPWMTSSGVKATKACAEFNIDYALLNSDGTQVGLTKKAAITINFIATAATTQTYYRSTYTPGTEAEPVPIGLARTIYDGLNRVQYKGGVSLTSDEVGDVAIGVGNLLNLIGLQAAWQTMKALITSVNDDVHNGIRTLTFGAPTQFQIADLVELTMPFRFRREAQYLRQQTGFMNGENKGSQTFHPEFTSSVIGAISDEGNKQRYGIAKTV